MSRPLYPLADEMLALLDRVSENEDMTEEEFNELMGNVDALKQETEQKLEGYWLLCVEFQSEIDKIKTETDRLNARKKHLESNIARLTRAIEAHMTKLDVEELRSDHYRFKFRRSSAVVIPDRFYEWAITHNPELLKIKYEADKRAVKELLADKTPDEVGGAYIQENKKVSIT